MLAVVAMVAVLPPAAICPMPPEVLRRGGIVQRSVVAIPQANVVGAQQAFDGVGQVLGLQVGELALLRADLHVEDVVVDLRDQALQRDAALHAGGRDQRGHDVARIDEGIGRGGRGDGRLLEEARGMAGCGDLLDALAEGIAAPNDVEDFGLVELDLDRTGADVISRSLQVEELCFHWVPFEIK